MNIPDIRSLPNANLWTLMRTILQPQGLVPGIHRQFLFTGLRLGLYEKVRGYFSGKHARHLARVNHAGNQAAIVSLVPNSIMQGAPRMHPSTLA